MTIQTSDYQILANRSTNIGGYRYFFNEQEADNEVYGEVANFGYEFRQYDSRLGRWWSVDPKWSEYPSVSPYVFCNGNPINRVDPKGSADDWIYNLKTNRYTWDGNITSIFTSPQFEENRTPFDGIKTTFWV